MGKLKYSIDLLKLLIAKCISPILKIINKDNKDIWLIGERQSEAKDNGYHLFKYIRINHPNDKVYYTIDKNSSDVEKIRDLGNIIYYNSFKHYIYYIMSSKLVCAHLGSCVPDSPVCWKFQERDMKNKKKIFIQHGITKELIPSLMYENTKADLFVCGAKPEYEFVKSEFGYPEGNVKYLGFARFDNLHDTEIKNQILIMPTWRRWIPSSTWSLDDKEESNKCFMKSEYYKRFNELINNKELIELLDRNDMKLIFYPHHEMQGYIDLFSTISNKIIIAKEDDYDVQQLLKDSKILVTDYSSVAFDFGYMRKTVIYYQFDNEKYNKEHYKDGYYNYIEHGFGPIVNNVNDLIASINDFFIDKNDNRYENIHDKFFNIYDNENCKRNFENIKQLI